MGASVSLIAGGSVAALVRGREFITVPVLGALEPWRIIFIVLGLPGLVVTLLFLFAREPARREQHHTEGTFSDFVQALGARRDVLVPHFAGACLQQIYAFAYTAWAPAFFMRQHGWSIVDVGLKYGPVQLVGGIAGAWLGGTLARSLWRRGRRDANLLTVAIAYGAMAVPAVLATMVPSATAAALLFGLAICFMQAPGGAIAAALQEIMPNRLRGRIIALYYAVAALSGMTLGPIVIGLMNDYVFGSELSIGKSLSLTAVLTVPLGSALVFLAARRRARLDLTG
jgi:MFS family permease